LHAAPAVFDIDHEIAGSVFLFSVSLLCNGFFAMVADFPGISREFSGHSTSPDCMGMAGTGLLRGSAIAVMPAIG
jgi:hypothetical protein